MLSNSELITIEEVLNSGGLLAYPTEAIYGIGCDPFNLKAVERVFQVKNRPYEKGLIVIAADFQQIEDLIIPTENMETIFQSWPGANTWVFSITDKVPTLLAGEFNSLAVRVTDHPIAKAICQAFGKPIVSTSANISTEPPVKTWQTLDPRIIEKMDYIVKGDVGGVTQCSSIRDARTLELIRA